MSRFETAINATGPDGNIYAVLGNATRFMRQLGIDPNEMLGLRAKVLAAPSYATAIDYIREWFPVDTGD